MTDEPFFPNQPPSLIRQVHRLQAVANRLSEADRLEVYSAVSHFSPTFEPTTFKFEAGRLVARQLDRDLRFPRPVPTVKLNHLTFGYEDWLWRKYTLPGFVEVRPGDVVVDCGAYVGGFSLGAARIAAKVHAFEPDRDNADCARHNLAGLVSATVLERGLYDRSGVGVLNVSASSVEHSLLTPDDGVILEQRSVPLVSLIDYARETGVSRFDFVKIEAEGVELEVFDGLEDMRPREFAIDVSPERNGESPADAFRLRLEPLGYEVRQRAHVMFARKLD